MGYLSKVLSAITLSFGLMPLAVALDEIPSDHAQKSFDIYTRLVETDTSKLKGNTVPIAQYLGSELIAAGFPEEDVEALDINGFGALVARYRGDDSRSDKPVLLLGHLDVVEALDSDWERPPFKLTSDETFFYGRGTKDNKFGLAQLTSTFIRLKKEGFVPGRDIYLVFSGDEESEMATTEYLVGRKDLQTAEYALNSDVGGGRLRADGTAFSYSLQVAEKTYATWEITARNPGGHSKKPRLDNAIYDLAQAIQNIQHYRFPVRWNEMTLSYFQKTGMQLGGELGDVMQRFAYTPTDTRASDRLFLYPTYVGTTRTTCVVTMLRAGHAENALPQSATATVNCRIFPGIKIEEIETALRGVVDNPEIEFQLLGKPVVGPASEKRADVFAAVSKAVHSRYPGLTIIPFVSPGATDGMHFRRAGIATYGAPGIFMDPKDDFAHGLNERVPRNAFHDALDHWSIILRELTAPK